MVAMRYMNCCATQKLTSYADDPEWKSWLALVEMSLLGLSDRFTPMTVVMLDQSVIHHLECFSAVDHYTGCEKPKHFLATNFAPDIFNMGPLIRNWCMSFEAIYQVRARYALVTRLLRGLLHTLTLHVLPYVQVLKAIASAGNYKDNCCKYASTPMHTSTHLIPNHTILPRSARYISVTQAGHKDLGHTHGSRAV